jgi:hypothetical protein
MTNARASWGLTLSTQKLIPEQFGSICLLSSAPCLLILKSEQELIPEKFGGIFFASRRALGLLIPKIRAGINPG